MDDVVARGHGNPSDYVLMCLRLAFRALLLAGRAPWLAFFSLRCGLTMVLKRS